MPQPPKSPFDVPPHKQFFGHKPPVCDDGLISLDPKLIELHRRSEDIVWGPIRQPFDRAALIRRLDELMKK